MPSHSLQLSGGFNYKIMPKKGYKSTKEHRKNLSKAQKGHIAWNKGKKGLYKHIEETKRKIGLSNSIAQLGKKQTEETKKKRLETRRKNGWWKNSKKTKEKISKTLQNHIVKKDTRNKIALLNKGMLMGDKNPAKRPEIRKILSEQKKGNKNPNWQNGKSFEPYTTDWTKVLRRSIRERDNYICQKCGQYGNTVHHIDYIKKNCNPDNLITLCNSCNLKVNVNRNYWTNYFNNLMILKVGKSNKKLTFENQYL